MRPIQNQQTSPDFVAANTLFSGMSYLDQRMSWLHTELYVYYITQNEQAQGSTGINQDQSAHGQLADLYTPGFRLFKPEAKEPSTTRSNPTTNLAAQPSAREAPC